MYGVTADRGVNQLTCCQRLWRLPKTPLEGDPAAMRVRLKRDSLEAHIAPDVGGGVAAFRCGGRDMFRAAHDDVTDPLAMAEFPMAPYVNRIAQGRFRWRNGPIAAPRNFGDHPHPLHGVGWRRAWACERLSASSARLRLVHEAAAAWPWRVSMERTIALTPTGLEIAFSLTNNDERPMPAAMGLHPYFPAAGAIVRLNATAQVLTADDGIPLRVERTASIDALAVGVGVCDLALDHCFTGWDGRAQIVWPTHALHMETDPPQRFVQLYTPAGANYFCLEPQSATPDAMNRENSGVVELAPGETLAFTTRFMMA